MLRVRTLWTGVAGAPWYTNVYFTGETASDAEEATLKMQSMWNNIRDSLYQVVECTVESEVVVVNPADGEVTDLYNVIPKPVDTNGSGEPLPFANQGLVQIGTGTVARGRLVKGRIFVPAALETDSTSGVPSGTYRTNLLDGAEMLVGAGGSGGDLAVWHRPLKEGSTVVSPGAEVLATSVSVSTQWAVLRSRRD